MWPRFFRKKKNKKKQKQENLEVEPRYVKICPKCNSINVEITHQGSLSGLTALGLPTMYRCKDCGFVGYSFPEIDLNKAKKLKRLRKVNKDKINKD